VFGSQAWQEVCCRNNRELRRGVPANVPGPGRGQRASGGPPRARRTLPPPLPASPPGRRPPHVPYAPAPVVANQERPVSHTPTWRPSPPSPASLPARRRQLVPAPAPANDVETCVAYSKEDRSFLLLHCCRRAPTTCSFCSSSCETMPGPQQAYGPGDAILTSGCQVQRKRYPLADLSCSPHHNISEPGKKNSPVCGRPAPRSDPLAAAPGGCAAFSAFGERLHPCQGNKIFLTRAWAVVAAQCSSCSCARWRCAPAAASRACRASS